MPKRRHLLAVALLALGSQAGPPALAAEARAVAATMYSDGHACPGGCDAHVVFQRSLNGTGNAFLPPLANRRAAAAHRCVAGQPCMVCFDRSDASCITVMYRGDGPPDGKLDFTPAFFAEWCPRADKPAALTSECAVIERAERRYALRLNCFAQPDHPACRPLIAEATAAQARDAPEYAACLRLGVRAYNRQQPDAQRHRSTRAGCGYAQNIRNCNSNGVCWQVLLPGACAPGSFVGRDGLDCCTGTLSVAGYLHPECSPYYPMP